MSEKELYNQLEKYDKEVNKLFQENKKLNNRIHVITETLNETYNNRTELRNENKQLKKNIDKTIKLTEKLYKMTKEQDSDNVNLIDRLENILNTLKGEYTDHKGGE